MSPRDSAAYILKNLAQFFAPVHAPQSPQASQAAPAIVPPPPMVPVGYQGPIYLDIHEWRVQSACGWIGLFICACGFAYFTPWAILALRVDYMPMVVSNGLTSLVSAIGCGATWVYLRRVYRRNPYSNYPVTFACVLVIPMLYFATVGVPALIMPLSDPPKRSTPQE